MVLVDTTVWIDFFNGTPNPKSDQLVSFLEEGEDLAICGVILTEVLQGLRTDNKAKEILDEFESLHYLETNRSAYIHASSIYRGCRKKGLTIRKPIDCIIAATCIESSSFLLHKDTDFDHIAKLFPLQFA